MSPRLPKFAVLALPALVLAATSTLTSSSRPATAPVAADAQYIGAGKCKNCHNSADSGDQYSAWENAKHSKAFEALGTDAAKTAGTAHGVADPATSDDCLKCHVTAHGLPEDAIKRGFKAEQGVQCETCHGPGSEHMKSRFKAAASGEKVEGYQGAAVEEMTVSPGVDVCVKCHNPGSPTYTSFCFFEYRDKIKHLNPQKQRTDEELANYGKCPCGSPCPHAEGCPDGTCNLKPEELASMRK